ncbi:ArsR family transcriptional regulator [Kitasatospora sp. NPDC050463]|uniref:ArsR/SmtB family transcription factor n=1 Tax=Kitasatospora sp. NPDC050463 TaxID=3155786 RepID=UPI0033D64290
MGELRFGVHDIVNIRFAISPLWETVASLRAVADPGRHVVHLPWIRRALALRQDRGLTVRTAPLSALLLPLHDDGPAFLTPSPRCPLAEIEEELAILLATPAEEVRAGLGAACPVQPRSPFGRRIAEDPERALPELADAVHAWWLAAVKPHWPRIRAVLEADIAHRTRQLAEDGIQQVLGGLHPSLHWAGDRLVSPDLPAAGLDLGGAGITLTPSAFAGRFHLLPGHRSCPPGAVYPSRALGVLWERRESAGDGLARLLGRSRAQLLACTSSPTTTTQLAARTGLSLGAVSQHLAVLRDAGLVTSHRYRREVNYTVSDLGTALLQQT